MSTYNCRGAINGIIVQNNPVNWVDPEGLSVEQILEAYEWILMHHPGVAEGVDPAFFDVNLPGDAGGAALPLDVILIDTNDLGSMEWIVTLTAHELLHAQKGFLGNIVEDIKTKGRSHDEIKTKAEKVRQNYVEWFENQKRKVECP